MSLNKLTPEEAAVMLGQNTEPPFTSIYNDFFVDGVYWCKQCDAPLYRS